MKKQLFFAVMLVSAALMVSCGNPGGKEDPSEKKGLTVNPHELTLVLGDNPVSISAKLNPNVAGATIKWESSNVNVATVTQRGYVQAVDYGDCYIYASYEDLKDSCYIHVQTPLEAAVFNGAIVWEVDTTYYKDPETGELNVREITASDGTKYKCYVSQALLFVFSDGFYINNAGRFDGVKQGVILEVEAPMFYATKYLNNSDYPTTFCLGYWAVTDTAGNWLRHTLPGTLDEVEYIKQQKKAFEAVNAGDNSYVTYWQAAAKAFTGPILKSYNYDTDESGEGGYYSSWVPEAICREAHFALNNNFPSSQFMCGIDYSTITYQQLATDTVIGFSYGLNLGYDEVKEQFILNDEKVHYNPVVTSTYGKVPAAGEEVAMKPLNVPIISEDPELAARIKEQIENHPNVVTLRKKF